MPQTENEIVNQIEHSFRHYDLGDVKKTAKGKMPVAAFILLTCFIDHLSRHRYYSVQKTKRPDDCQAMVDFIKEYFPQEYKGIAKNLYLYLRSALVHNYSVKGKFFLDNERPQDHLLSIQGRILLNDERLIEDVEVAFEKFIVDLHTKDEVRQNAIRHYTDFSIIQEANLN